MQTVLKGKSNEVAISTDGPMVIIGESINPTRRKKLTAALEKHEFEYVIQLAERQIAAGADILDVNVGLAGGDEVSLLPAVIEAITAQVDVPLCLDSANPPALAAGLAVTPGRAMINSVNGEEASLQAILPLVKEYNAAVIGLVMDDNGIPATAEERLAVAAKIIERAASLGIPLEDIVIDPLVMAVSADHNAARITLETIRLVRQEFGVNISLGASNVSFGLPEREILNQAFLAVAAGVGASAAITDPVKLGMAIRAIDLLLGHDEFSMRYIRHYRAQQQQ